jgi:hypothetical protein
MAGVDRQLLYDVLSQFVTDLWQLVDTQFSQVVRIVDAAQ